VADFRLIVTEKPSVARDIARSLHIQGRGAGVIDGGDTKITWCLGHLIELAEPSTYDASWKSWRMETLPMMPETFRLKARKDTRDQWKVVRELLRDKKLREVVNACDAGREGELIFSNVYRYSGCKAPVRRLWISSMTAGAIRGGFDRLRDGADMCDLQDAARCRSEADWLVGLNATRAMTLRARQAPGSVLLSLGRVQTPTLAMMVAREIAIEQFVPQAFWQVKVRFAVDAGEWEAVYVEPGPDGKRADRLGDRALAEAVVERIRGCHGEVAAVRRKRKREKPPLLYDLTTLQKEGNRRFRYSAKRTLEIAQALYEKHKVLTYPRTDARHIGNDQVPELPGLLEALRFGPYQGTAERVLAGWPQALGKRVVDDGEVSDHHAIIPTGVDPTTCSLRKDEKRIFDLVARRFLAVFLPDAVFAVAEVDTAIGEDLFAARGRTCLDPGWREIDPPASAKKRDDEVELPPVEEEDAARQVGHEIHEGETKPPRRFTEATLLTAMERAGESLEDVELKRAMKRNGLGTPATRASIIETLLGRGYVERKRRNLQPTSQGRALIGALPVEALSSPQLTGEWESRLVAMTEGREARGRFMTDIRDFTVEMVTALRDTEIGAAQLAALAGSDVVEGAELGACPLCGKEVRGARFGWSCTACEFRLPGQVAKRQVSERMARQLLTEGRVGPVKGFRSKKGKTFRAALKLDEEGKVVFDFPPREERPLSEELGTCPACGEPVRARGKVYTCDSLRDCPFVVFLQMSGRDIPEGAVKQMLRDGRSAPMTGFKTKAGRSFDAVLEWNGQRVKVARVDSGPAPAFGRRVDCPVCAGKGEQDPGYVIAGKAAWGCSRWKSGCPMRVPFVIEGVPLPEEEARRLFGHHRATRFMKRQMGPSGEVYSARVVLRADEDPCWALERGKRR